MFVRLLDQGYCVGRLIASGTKRRDAGFTHVQVHQKALPFSFSIRSFTIQVYIRRLI